MAKVLGFQIEINGTQRAISTSEELRRAIADIGKELKKATDTESIQKLEKELVDLKARQAEVNKETREGIKLRQQELTAVDKSTGAYAKQSKELVELSKRYKDLAAAGQESSEEAQRLIKRIVELDSKLKAIDGSVGQFQRNVGNYPKVIASVIPGLDSIVDSIDNVKSATSGVGIGLGALGVAFTAFSTVSAIFDDLNRSLQETKQLSAQIQNFTGQAGEALQESVSQARAIANTYKEDVQEIAVAANTLSKELGIDFARAFELIEAGFRKGANAQGEFLDGLREYPAQFRDAGASAEDFIRVSIAAANSGIYSDKALDAVKEFGLRVREQTKATGDALNAAIGEKRTKEIFDALNNGSIKAVDALGLITEELKRNGVQGAKLQTVIADVFGGPGEDVGQEFLFTLGEIFNKTEDVTESTTGYQKELASVYQQNLELNKAQQEYNKLLEETGTSFQTVQIKAKTFFARTAAALIDFGDAFKAGFDRLFFGDNTGVERRIQARADRLNAVIEKNRKKQLDSLKTFGAKQDVFQFGAADEKEVEKKAEKTGEKVGGATGKGYTKGAKTEIKKGKEEIEKEIEAQNLALEKAARAQFRAQISGIGEELQFVAAQLNQQGFADVILSGLSPDKVSSQTASIAKNIVKEFDKIRPELAQAAERLFSPFSKEVAQVGEDIANFVDKFRVEEVFSAALDVISAFQNARAEKEQEAFQLQIEQIDANIQALEERQQNVGRIRAKQIQREINAAKLQREQAEKQAEEAQKKAAKREKTLAIIQATVQTALGVARALGSAPPPINFINAGVTAVLGAAQIATIAAQPLATGGIITGRRVTDRQNIPTQASGDNVLAVVKRGEVVLNERQQAALGGSGTFRAIGVPGFAGGGIVPPITAPAAAMAGSGGDLFAALDRKTDAINQRIDRIQAYVVSEEIRSDLAEGDKLKIEATL